MGHAARARAVLVTLSAVLLVGCSGGSTGRAGPTTVDASSSPTIGGRTPVPRAGQSPATATATAGATAGASDSQDEVDRSVATADPSPAAEVPVAPDAPVESLSDLLDEVDTTPLVTAPLPRAASARGRLVRAYPGLLRPSPDSRVESSSISSSGGRLQVGLVASTPARADRVLLAYRTRLARRGLAEQDAPVAAAGSHTVAFRRGRSVVTLTVTEQESQTFYVVHATLHTGGG